MSPCKDELEHKHTLNTNGIGAPDLVDFVEVDDSSLGALDVVVAFLQQLIQHRLNVLADVASLGQHGAVGHGKGHVEYPRQ